MKRGRRCLCLLAALLALMAGQCRFTVMGAGPGEQDSWYFLYSGRYTYGEMEADLNHLEEKYGGLVKIESLASTADGRNLYHILVGNEQAGRHILVTASIHAREYISSQLVMRQLEELLRQYSENALMGGASARELLENTAVHIVPMANPDGVTLCQLGLDGMQRPQIRDTVMEIYGLDGGPDWNRYLTGWKSNAVGVDLNRNFDAGWDLHNDQVGHRSSGHYKGSSVESEAETKALVQLTRRYPFRRTISYHTQGNVIYWYFGQNGELEAESRSFAELASAATGYRIDSAFENLDPAGYKDWAVSKMQIPSLTIEVGTGTSPVDPAQFPAIWEQNKDILPAVLASVYADGEQGRKGEAGHGDGWHPGGPGYYVGADDDGLKNGNE